MEMEEERVYKRTYTALRIHAFRQHGYIAGQDFARLNLPTRPDILDEVLKRLESEGKLHVNAQATGGVMYDFLPFLEETVADNVLDMNLKMQLAKIYLDRQLWTPAIAELRLTATHPQHKKESLYWLGRCFEAKGAVEKAREHYERVLASDFFYLDTPERLARLTEQAREQTTNAGTTMRVTSRAEFTTRLQDRYEIARELGRGGAGIVYQAIDVKLKRDVALKLFYQQAGQDAARMARFLQEARLAAQLKHPNIVDIYDVNLEAQFIAMEYVAGGTLRQALTKSQQLTATQACGVIGQLCRGLQIAHEAGILHRDIKPENIFITQQKQIKLGDFGIAHLNSPHPDDFTHIATQIGTLPYMSPEQVRGEPLQAASDIYAVGIVFYELLTGSPPFTRGDIAYHHLYTAPAPLELAPTLAALVLRCLAKDPAQRVSSAAELQRLVKAVEQDVQARLAQYRELVKMAVIDRELSPAERLILKLKQKALQLTDAEACRIEREAGLG